MAKFLIIIALIAIVAILLMRKKPNSAQENAKSAKTNDMVACARCGDYVVQNDAILASGKWYCSVKCLQNT